ncbi:MAG TPA: hypothetical protein VJ302_22960 [Blastocatellia bacterium]|nr:hypothetical protein [Blastocatellia bacterium]
MRLIACTPRTLSKTRSILNAAATRTWVQASRSQRRGWRLVSWLAGLLLISTLPGWGQEKPALPADGLTSAEFGQLIAELSEEGGYFRSDNFTSNETSYLHIVDKLRQLGAQGGAYLGVGPEQNFTYIAKVRPRIAFIVDIRRQAVIQHLMYKAIFHLSPTRPQFLARLLSRAVPTEKTLAPGASIEELALFFSQSLPDDQLFASNLATIRKMIQEEFRVPLSERDQTSLEYVYKNFRNEGLSIAFRIDGSGAGDFPTLKDLLVQTDLRNKQGNFLAGEEDYQFVRGLHRKNLIIPVVGDFSGKKALAAVGDYLRKRGLTITAFYTSNVEQYLFDGTAFINFANNVRKLPITEQSLLIRSVSARYQHPARLQGHRSATIMQQISVFLRDFDANRYPNYNDLIMTNYIAAENLPGPSNR